MVHRATDSRLLTNLIANEREYTKHLAALFPLSHSALTSLSAYAAASPSHPSSPAQSITAVVDVLASADDALQRYSRAIDTWREQLVSLKALEDDLNAVLRDRDILVTRLIRASRSTRDAHRSSRLINPLSGRGSASSSSLPSASSATTGSGSGSGPASTNSKLAHAQAELQACEAHLVAKERELDARRISVAREGLGVRCRALIDCGWVWNEMGKQGLRALQALGANSVASSNQTISTLTPAIQPHLNAATYTSDNSSLTPSQSASQTATRSIEASHEGSAFKDHERTTEPETKHKVLATQRPATRPEEPDLTITLLPAHAISELTLPTGTRSQPRRDGDSAAQKQTVANANPAPEQKRIKRSRRPPSQHITEASDEGSDGPSSSSKLNAGANATSNTDPPVPHATLPINVTPGAHDTSSDDDRLIGSLQVVENDPFEVIRKSMLGPSASAPFLTSAPPAPVVRAGTSDAHGDETNPSRAAFPGSGSGPGPTSGPGISKRERRPSAAFFGSLRGIFRKPKGRDRAAAEWDEDHSPPSPSLPSRWVTKGNERRGWVTRTDVRIKGSRGGDGDSDSEATPTQTPTALVTIAPVVNVARRGSGARLHKGRPGASTRGAHESGPFQVILSRHADADVHPKMFPRC